MRTWACVLFVTALLASAGCGDDGPAERFSPVGPDQHHDGGPGRDGGRTPATDPGEHDTEIFSGDLYLCGYDDEDALVRTGSAAQPELAIAADERGFALAHHDPEGALWLTALPLASSAQDEVRIVSAADAPASVALAARREGFLLAWRSGGATGTALNVRELSTVEHPIVELSSALAPRASVGEVFALLGLGDGFAAAWIDAAGSEPTLKLAAIGDDGEPTGEALTLAAPGAGAAEDLHLALLDRDRTMLSWLDRDTDGAARVTGQLLDGELAPRGDPAELSGHAVAEGRFGFAGRNAGAGLIYPALDGAVREAIKYRRIDQDGSAVEAVLNIVNAPGRAVGGAIAPFGQGYAVAYRALPSLGVAQPVIRIAFINQFGTIVHEAELAETTEEGGPTAVAATADGHLLVGWTSTWPAGPSTHALALHCPGALVLCGGAVEP